MDGGQPEATAYARVVRARYSNRPRQDEDRTRASSRSHSEQKPRSKRIHMIAAVLRRHSRRTVQELIALLDKEYRWKTNGSAVTGKLYTRRDNFVHTEPDRSTNRPVTWSLK
jgi:hypothetical protein